MPDDLGEMDAPAEGATQQQASDEKPDEKPRARPQQPLSPLMGAGIGVIVVGVGLLIWLGPSFNIRKPPTPKPLAEDVRAQRLLQKWDGMDSAARQAALPELVELFKIDNDDIRINAMLTLGREGKEAVSPLVAALQDQGNEHARQLAAWALGRIGSDATAAVPALLAACKDPDRDVRRKAVYAIGKIRPPATTAVPALIESSQDEDVDVRRTAVEALAPYGKDAVPALLKALQSPDWMARSQAVLAVTAIGPEAVDTLPALTALFWDSRGGLQEEAAGALGRLGKPAVPTLAAALTTDPALPPGQVVLGLGSPYALLCNWRDYAAQHRRALAALAEIGPDALDVLLPALSNRNADVREQAVAVLGALGQRDKRIVVPLTEALRDPEPGVRQQAGWALIALAPDAHLLLPGFRRALQHRDVEVRAGAVELMGLFGGPALSALVEALRDKDKKVHEQAVQRLRELRVDNDTLIAVVVPLLKDESPAVRQGAVIVLHRCGAVALPHLLGALKDPDVTVRLVAIDALTTVQADGKLLFPALAEALKDSDANVRAGAASALSRFGIQAVALLREALKDKDEPVRVHAVAALHQIGPGSPQAFPALETVVKDESAGVRLAVAAALARFGDRGQVYLIGYLGEENDRIWKQAVDSLLALEGPTKTLMPPLLAALRHKDRSVRAGAAYALARFGADGVPALKETMKDPVESVQSAAVDTLDTIGAPARDAIPELVDAAVNHRNPKIARRALDALLRMHGIDKPYKIDPASTVPHLLELLGERDPKVRWGVIQTLAAMGPKARDAVPALKEALKDPNLSVSQSAQYALRRIQGN